MGLYIYAIIDSNKEIDTSIKGMAGMSLCNIIYQDIGAVSGNIDKKIEETEEHILEHEKVSETLMDKFTVLPVRFNTLFNNREDVLKTLKGYYSDFIENFNRLRHKVEFGLKVIWSGEKIKQHIIDTYTKGELNTPLANNSLAKKFMADKFKEYKIDQEFTEEADKYITLIDSYFDKIASDKKLQKLQSEKLLLNAFYLVEKDKESDFDKSFDQLRDSHPDFRYLLSGPWPPYNFITLTKKSPLSMKSLAERL